MRLFDNNPQSKAMQSLIHDTRNTGDSIRFHGTKLREWFKEKQIKDSMPWVYLEHITGGAKSIEKSIDVYYECFSNDFPDALPVDFKPEAPTAYHLAEQFMPEGNWKGDKMELYKAFGELIKNYTLIRKPNSEQSVQGSDTTMLNQGTKPHEPNKKVFEEEPTQRLRKLIEAEIAKVKGEYEALESVDLKKKGWAQYCATIGTLNQIISWL